MYFCEVENLTLKKIFLYLLIASVGLSAFIGIVVILFGNFGELETKILLTTLTITVISILGLACGAYFETNQGRILPVCGIVFAVVSAILWIILIWNGTIQNDLFVKTLMSATLLAVACSHVSLLSIAKLERKFLWSRFAVHASIWTLTAILLFLIWSKFDPGNTWLARIIGVLTISVATLTIITPIFHKLSGQIGLEEIDAEIDRLKSRILELEKQRGEIKRDQA